MNHLLAISGSSRTDSLNQQTLSALTRRAKDRGASVRELDLRALDIPLYDGDLEAEHGLPDGVVILRDAMLEADAFIVACPEYNGFPPPMLINAIDWASRGEGQRGDLSPYRDKVVLVCSASPGGFGGMRAAGHLRTMLSGIGCFTLPQSLSVPGAMKAFNDEGAFADEQLSERADAMIDRLLSVTAKLAGL